MTSESQYQEFLDQLNNAIAEYEKAIGNYASRTRQMIDDYGPVEALSKLVVSPDLQRGFETLRDHNKLDIIL